MTGSFGGTYNTGTMTLTNGSGAASFSGTLMTLEAEVGDFIYVNPLNLVIYVNDVTDDTHLGITPVWGGTTQTNIAYTLLKTSYLRYDPAITQQKQRELLAFYEALGFFYFVEGASPDPGIGIDGQWALKANVTPWQVWYHTGGVWVAQSAAATGLNPKGAWSNVTAYVKGDSVDRLGSSYICILAHTNQAPPNATYWQVLASIGNTGPVAWTLPTAWATATSYTATAPSSTVVQSGNTYVCIVSHTSGTFATDLAAGKWQLVAQAAPIYNISSTASLAIGTGSKAFTGVVSNNAYQIGDYVRAKSAANGVNFMEGNVTANSAGTLTVNVTKVGGSGTFADWNISPTGAPGAGDVLSTNNGSEFTPATFATNLSLLRYAAQTLTAAQKSQARANIGVERKNYIVNGGMQVSQENPLTAASPGDSAIYYPVDQFYYFKASTTGVASVTQVASTTPSGSPNRVRVTVTTADATVDANDRVRITHPLEGLRVADLKAGLAGAKTVTLQFGVKAPQGTYCVAIGNASGARSYVAEYTISAGEANSDVVKSVTLQLDTGNTWATDNTLGIVIYWTLMAGSSYQGTAGSWLSSFYLSTSNQLNFMGTVGNTFELFDVGLYEGSFAPEFLVPDYAVELPLCQRYFEKIKPGGGFVGIGGFENSSRLNLWCTWNVIKRAAPVISFTTASDWTVRQNAGAITAAASSISPGTAQATVNGAFCDCNVATAPFTPGQFGVLQVANSNAAYFVSARL